jgi:hypothetical protein
MKGTMIFGKFTVLETFKIKNMIVDKGFTENLEILYQIRFCTENDRDDVDYELLGRCYRSLDELMEELG